MNSAWGHRERHEERSWNQIKIEQQALRALRSSVTAAIVPDSGRAMVSSSFDVPRQGNVATCGKVQETA
jgi:hypothetical protein